MIGTSPLLWFGSLNKTKFNINFSLGDLLTKVGVSSLSNNVPSCFWWPGVAWMRGLAWRAGQWARQQTKASEINQTAIAVAPSLLEDARNFTAQLRCQCKEDIELARYLTCAIIELRHRGWGQSSNCCIHLRMRSNKLDRARAGLGPAYFITASP